MINVIYINEIVISNKLPLGKQDFKYFIGYKDNSKIRLHAYYFQNKNDILIKLNVHIFEKVFDKYMKILQNVSSIVKKINSELIYI